MIHRDTSILLVKIRRLAVIKIYIKKERNSNFVTCVFIKMYNDTAQKHPSPLRCESVGCRDDMRRGESKT